MLSTGRQKIQASKMTDQIAGAGPVVSLTPYLVRHLPVLHFLTFSLPNVDESLYRTSDLDMK